MAGPDEENWRAQLELPLIAANLSSRVHWTGMLNGAEKWGAFLCSGAFILPSHQENFGIAVTEAMACSKPVLLSNKVNIAPEILAAGAGLMDEDTEDGTFRMISSWLAMLPQARAAMGCHARELFESRYDMRIHGHDIALLLHDATQSDLAQLATPVSAVK